MIRLWGASQSGTSQSICCSTASSPTTHNSLFPYSTALASPPPPHPPPPPDEQNLPHPYPHPHPPPTSSTINAATVARMSGRPSVFTSQVCFESSFNSINCPIPRYLPFLCGLESVSQSITNDIACNLELVTIFLSSILCYFMNNLHLLSMDWC